jgi:hypothetical protein
LARNPSQDVIVEPNEHEIFEARPRKLFVKLIGIVARKFFVEINRAIPINKY